VDAARRGLSATELRRLFRLAAPQAWAAPLLVALGFAASLAETLGINPVTVASRIERMEKARLLRTVAIADFAAFGLDLLLTIGVEVQNRRAAEVAHDLAQLPEVFSVQEVTGARDIEMLVAVTDIAALRDFMLRLGAIAGIRSLDTGIAIDVVKYSPDMAPLR